MCMQAHRAAVWVDAYADGRLTHERTIRSRIRDRQTEDTLMKMTAGKRSKKPTTGTLARNSYMVMVL